MVHGEGDTRIKVRGSTGGLGMRAAGHSSIRHTGSWRKGGGWGDDTTSDGGFPTLRSKHIVASLTHGMALDVDGGTCVSDRVATGSLNVALPPV